MTRGAAPADWWLYMVRCRDGSLYTGIATDVPRRLAEHAAPGGRGARYLRGRGPLKLVLQRRIGPRPLALRVEAGVKRLTRAGKEELAGRGDLLGRLIDRCAARPVASSTRTSRSGC